MMTLRSCMLFLATVLLSMCHVCLAHPFPYWDDSSESNSQEFLQKLPRQCICYVPDQAIQLGVLQLVVGPDWWKNPTEALLDRPIFDGKIYWRGIWCGASIEISCPATFSPITINGQTVLRCWRNAWLPSKRGNSGRSAQFLLPGRWSDPTSFSSYCKPGPNSFCSKCVIPTFLAGGTSYPGSLYGSINGGSLGYIQNAAGSYACGATISGLICYTANPSAPTQAVVTSSGQTISELTCSSSGWQSGGTIVNLDSSLYCGTTSDAYGRLLFTSYAGLYGQFDASGTLGTILPLNLLDGISFFGPIGTGTLLELCCDNTCTNKDLFYSPHLFAAIGAPSSPSNAITLLNPLGNYIATVPSPVSGVTCS